MWIGILFTIISALSYSLQTFFIKVGSTAIPLPIIVFLQSLISLIIMILVIIKKYGIFSPFLAISSSKIKKLHLVRTVFSLGISYFLFGSLKYLPYFDAILFYNTFSLFIPFVALIILGDKIKHQLWPFILIGFFGVSLTLNLDSKIFSLPAILGICSGICAASAMVMSRKVSQIDDPVKGAYFFFLFSTIIAGIVALPFYKFLMDINWPIIIIIGFLYFFVQFFITVAAKFIPPTLVANLYYTNIIFSLVISYTALNANITFKIVMGATFIIAGGLGVVYFQKKSSLRAKKNIE